MGEALATLGFVDCYGLSLEPRRCQVSAGFLFLEILDRVDKKNTEDLPLRMFEICHLFARCQPK
jgi:hypothetical protein